MKFLKLIILIFATIAMVYFAFAFSVSSWPFESHYRLYVELEDATGVTTKSLVEISGYKIGEVSNMTVVDRKVIAELSIDKEIKLPGTSQFYLVKESFLNSTRSFAVDYDKTVNEVYADGDTIRTKIQYKDLTETLDPALKELSKAIGTALIDFSNKNLPDTLVLEE